MQDVAGDLAIMARIQGGESSALGELYDRYGAMALRLAGRLLGDSAAAEDAVQDAFLAVWCHAETYRPSAGAVHNWLLSIVRHRAIDKLRRGRPERHTVSIDPELTISEVDVLPTVLSRLEQQRVRRAIATLPFQQRRAIELTYFLGFTAREAADRESIPVGTLKSRLRLALCRLRENLQPLELAEGA